MASLGNGGGSSMNGSGGNGYRSSRPGMGLQQAAPPRREPLAPLEVREGGDVKRIKR